ncbi:MAG: hypothetical protein ACREJQ_05335, partial [bacterium]
GGGKYLVVWQEDRGATAEDILGVFVSPEGFLTGSPFVICNCNGTQQFARVVYNGADLFLVVWEDQRNGSLNPTIFGARVTAGTQQVLDPDGFLVPQNTSNKAQIPEVGSINGDFLAIWKDTRLGQAGIYGARITPAKTITGDLPLVTGGNTRQRPSLTSSGTQYLLLWDEIGAQDSDVFGLRVSAAGSPTGSPFVISDAAGTQQRPSGASDGTNFLVAWEDDRSGNFEIYGSRVSSSGSVLDSSGVPISTVSSLKVLTDVAFGSGKYFAVWSDTRNDPFFVTTDIYGAFIDSTSGAPGPDFAVGASPQRQSYGRSTFDEDAFLTVWIDNRNSGSLADFDIFGHIIEP